MSDFPEMEYKANGDEAPTADTALELLQEVYRSPMQPLPVRMRAAMAALPFETPKLAVTTNISNENFSAMLEKAIARSRLPQIELKAEPEGSDRAIRGGTEAS